MPTIRQKRIAKTKQKEVEYEYCKRFGFEPNELNMLMAPVIYVEWTKEYGNSTSDKSNS